MDTTKTTMKMINDTARVVDHITSGLEKDCAMMLRDTMSADMGAGNVNDRKFISQVWSKINGMRAKQRAAVRAFETLRDMLHELDN